MLRASIIPPSQNQQIWDRRPRRSQMDATGGRFLEPKPQKKPTKGQQTHGGDRRGRRSPIKCCYLLAVSRQTNCHLRQSNHIVDVVGSDSVSVLVVTSTELGFSLVISNAALFVVPSSLTTGDRTLNSSGLLIN